MSSHAACYPTDDPTDWQGPLDGETSNAYAAYVAYRDIGPRRTAQKAAQAYYELEEEPDRTSAKVRQIQTWSAQWHWVARAREWDAEVDRQVRLEQADALKVMRDRHAAIAADALSKIETRLASLDEAELTVSELARLMEVATKIERQSRGEPDSITEVSGPEHGRLPVEDLGQGLSIRELAEMVLAQDSFTVDGAAFREKSEAQMTAQTEGAFK